MKRYRVTVMVPMEVTVEAERRRDVTYEVVAGAVEELIAQGAEGLRDHLDFSAITPEDVHLAEMMRVLGMEEG
jgi:hypothetical protein